MIGGTCNLKRSKPKGNQVDRNEDKLGEAIGETIPRAVEQFPSGCGEDSLLVREEGQATHPHL